MNVSHRFRPLDAMRIVLELIATLSAMHPRNASCLANCGGAATRYDLVRSGRRRSRRFPRRLHVQTLGLAAALVIAASVALAPAASASTPPAERYGFSQDRSTPEDHSDWLANVNGKTPIWQLSIPGSHDSYTGQVSLGAGDTTQTLPVAEQLKMGIRALDLRLKNCPNSDLPGCTANTNDFWVEHGGTNLGITLGGVLSQLQSYLAAHPTEFVIVRAQIETEGDYSTFETRWTSLLRAYDSILWTGNQPQGEFANPTLDEVRGKVVLLQQTTDSGTGAIQMPVNNYGMTYGTSSFIIEDNFHYDDEFGLAEKWANILPNWAAAVNYAKTGDTSQGYITYISASSSGFNSPTPAFFAGVGGVTTDLYPDDYPDFPSTDICENLAPCTVLIGIDFVMYDALSQQHNAGQNRTDLSTQNGMGLIYINFMGQPLVNAIMANNPGTGPTGRIVSGVDNTKCLDSNAGIAVQGNKVQIWDCGSYAPSQKWTINPDQTVNIGGGCLDIPGGVRTPPPGTAVDWWTCGRNTNQQWELTVSGQLRNPYSGLCLVPNGSGNGADVRLQTCDDNSPSQKWIVPGPPTGSIRSGVTALSQAAKCVDLHDSSHPVNGAKVQMWDCNLTPSQNWKINSDGTVRIVGGCLDINGAVYDNGTKVQWQTCNGGDNQQWQVTAGSELVNPHSGQCLDDPQFVTNNGTQLEIHSCNGGANQKWYVPNF